MCRSPRQVSGTLRDPRGELDTVVQRQCRDIRHRSTSFPSGWWGCTSCGRRSAIDPPLHVRGVALTLDVDPVGGRSDFLEVLRGELDVDAPEFSCRRWTFVVPGMGTIHGRSGQECQLDLCTSWWLLARMRSAGRFGFRLTKFEQRTRLIPAWASAGERRNRLSGLRRPECR